MNPSRRIGILGGTFDPIHCGHLDAGTAAQRALVLDGVLVLPTNFPPHRPRPIASGHHRFAMAAMAVAGRPGWRALDLELQGTERSYTADTLRRLHATGLAPSELFFITGADAFLDIATWKDYPALFDLSHFAIVSRPGVPVGGLPAQLPALAERMKPPSFATGCRPGPVDPAPQAGPKGPALHGQMDTWIFLIDARTADVSATAIRRERHDGRSIAGLVPPAVQQHIEQHDLYGVPNPAAIANRGAGDARAGRLHGQD